MVNNYVLIYPQDFYPILLLSHYIVDSILNFGYSSCHIPYGSQSSNSFLFFRIRKQSPIVRAFSIVRGLLLTTKAFWSLHRIQQKFVNVVVIMQFPTELFFTFVE